jgi:tetratricopeptide (TPR) repeat protein
MAAYYAPGKTASGKAEARTADGRAQAYREKMRELHKAYSNDSQGTLFLALAILAANDQGTKADQLAQAREAGALIEPVFAAEPDNPGAAHYLIHAYDRPQLAPGALAAARAYARIAPNAPHALHMPSHIFERLGLWQEMVDSNIASYDAAKASMPQTGEKIHEELHASDFLQYAYLQLGEFQKAQQTTDTAVAIAKAHADRFSKYIEYSLPSRMVIEQQKWSDWKSVTEPDGKDDAYWKAEYLWLEVMAEARACSKGTLMASRENGSCTKEQAKHNAKKATEALHKLKAIGGEAKKHDSYGDAGSLDVLMLEAEGWDAFARGDRTAAVAKMKDAVTAEAKPGSYGGYRKPAAEMLGDLYLLLGDKSAAAAAYQESLKEHPGRRLSEAGLKAAQA